MSRGRNAPICARNEATVAKTEVFINQRDDTPAPDGKITGIITEQKSKKGTPKFKKASQEDGGKDYQIIQCSPPREWSNDFGTFKTYYLTIDDDTSVDVGKAVAPKTVTTPWMQQVETSIKALKKEVEKLQAQVNPTPSEAVQGSETAVERRKSQTGTQTPPEVEDLEDLSGIPF